MNAFEAETNRSLSDMQDKYPDFFYFRLYDTKSFRLISENIFAYKQPSDYVAVFKGKVYFLELKSTHSDTSFSFRYIRQHQMDSLLRADKAGAKSFFVINDRSTKRHFKSYAVKASTLNDFINSTDKHSIKWDELEKISLSVDRMNNMKWDYNKVFNIYLM